jgi:hypothetical protein
MHRVRLGANTVDASEGKALVVKYKIRWVLVLFLIITLKGLSHDIFRPVFWPVWIYLGLNGNRFAFLNFKEDSFILDSYFKY